MIEDCMLLANKVVASILLKSKHPSIFRIHEDPDEEQWSKMSIELDALGIPFSPNSRDEINEIFKFINPKEQSSCGCGVSINFDLEQVEVDKSKIFAIEL